MRIVKKIYKELGGTMTTLSTCDNCKKYFTDDQVIYSVENYDISKKEYVCIYKVDCKNCLQEIIKEYPVFFCQVIEKSNVKDLPKEDRLIWKRHLIAEMKKMNVPVIKKAIILQNRFSNWIDDIDYLNEIN